MKLVHFGKRTQPVYGASSVSHFPCCSSHSGQPRSNGAVITTSHKTKTEEKLSWFREEGKPVAQAASPQELEKAAAFCSHLELNCHLKELSSAFIPEKNNYFYGADRQIGKHVGNCFVDPLPLLYLWSKWKK